MSSNRTPDDARRGEARISFSPEKRTKGGGGSASRTLADSETRRETPWASCVLTLLFPQGPHSSLFFHIQQKQTTLRHASSHNCLNADSAPSHASLLGLCSERLWSPLDYLKLGRSQIGRRHGTGGFDMKIELID